MTKSKVKYCLDEMLLQWKDEFHYLPASNKAMEEAVDYAKEAIDMMPDGLTVKINTHGNEMPEQHGEWIDLSAAEDTNIKAGCYQLISLGVSMELPAGYYAKIVPRSSACSKFGIMMANSVGIIENDYNGDGDIWHFPAYAIRDTHIPKGARICQFCVVKQEKRITLTKVAALGNDDRGGLGSTGF